MGTTYVKNIAELNNANRLFRKRVKALNVRVLNKLANVNLETSQQIVETVKFQGTLHSSINLNTINNLKIRVICSAPYGYDIEKGIPYEGKGEYVDFEDNPDLKKWVKDKLMSKDKEKADYFLRVGAVKVGAKGFPYGYPHGIKFMELGAEFSVKRSKDILTEELIKLN